MSLQHSRSRLTLGKSGGLILTMKAPAKRPRLRNILRHHSVACTLFTFFSIKERVTRLHVLNKMAQSKVYKHAMEPALRQACN